MGDSTDGIQGIPKVGPKTADKWLSTCVCVDEMPSFVLNEYIKYFGDAKGISKFAETFKLIYILKTKEDVLRDTDIIFDTDTSAIYTIDATHDDLWE